MSIVLSIQRFMHEDYLPWPYALKLDVGVIFNKFTGRVVILESSKPTVNE